MDRERIVSVLNNALAHEYACQIRYLTHAALMTGPRSELAAEKLMEMAEDEERHASKLRHRIAALGGRPVMIAIPGDRFSAETPAEMLEVDLEEERKAIDVYYSLLGMVAGERDDLYDIVEEMLEDEQDHMKELEQLKEQK
jgi:bacterioferritin